MLQNVTAFLMFAGLALASMSAIAEGDPAAGQDLAADWCSRCHDIGKQGQMKQDPPSFAAIAVYRSPDQIRSKIIAPHVGMPEVAQILGLEVDDLIAYIVSLETE